MTILYITRKFLPSIGGMQKMNSRLMENIRRNAAIDDITWGYSQIFLPVFVIKVLIKSFIYLVIKRRKYDLVLLGDSMLSPIGAVFKKLLHKPIVCIAHGLDVTFNSSLYQSVVMGSLKKMNRIICVSEYTKNECISRGIAASKLRVVPNGVDLPARQDSKEALNYFRNKGIVILDNTKVLLTVGRLVKRKGVAEFIKDVFVPLAREMPQVIYLVIGEGREAARINKIIDDNGVRNKVFVMGKVSEKVLGYAYSVAHLFIMYNIKVSDNVEGFGMVALEASSYRVPVIAADLEGIKDAVKEGENGILVPPQKPDIFLEKVICLLKDEKSRAQISNKSGDFAKCFSWQEVSNRYVASFQELI